MKTELAIISDIHGNLEALNEVMDDIRKRDIDNIICLGDTIDIGPDSKECIDVLMDNDIKMLLGNHELYLLRGTDIEPSIKGEEKAHYEWVKNNLTEKEIEYISNCPLYFDYPLSYDNNIPDKTIRFCHYLIDNENEAQPFEKNHLKRDINLWLKHNDPKMIHIIGHLHKSFTINDIDGISNDNIKQISNLNNINIVGSAGCSYDDTVSYDLLEISENINLKEIKVKYDRKAFIDKVMNTNFPDKEYILKAFYGMKNKI